MVKDIVCWFSGGITSAVACKLAINIYGVDRCRVIFMDTFNEHIDTYRFKDDCSDWYGIDIETITAIGKEYNSIEDVWYKYKSLNVANGAICSSELKKEVRTQWQKKNSYTHQVFGFEFDKKEFNRAMSMSLSYPDSKPIFPLLLRGFDKPKCLEILQDVGIEVPLSYRLGFKNNNCLKTGCVQGGIGYWQKMFYEMRDLYDKMAKIEHDLTDLKNGPVTMLKDQSKESQELAKKLGLKRKYCPLFLKRHPKYPEFKTVMDKKARAVEPLMECNGFCGTNDLLPKSKTVEELNLDG